MVFVMQDFIWCLETGFIQPFRKKWRQIHPLLPHFRGHIMWNLNLKNKVWDWVYDMSIETLICAVVDNGDRFIYQFCSLLQKFWRFFIVVKFGNRFTMRMSVVVNYLTVLRILYYVQRKDCRCAVVNGVDYILLRIDSCELVLISKSNISKQALTCKSSQ